MTAARLLHGLGADRRAFQRFERLLPDTWKVTSLDLLGHGEAPHPDHGYSLDDHAAWIEGRIELDAPVLLIGHSYGAATATAVAARRPELVSAIVLLDPIVDLDASRDGTKTGRMIEA
jgi:lipase